MAEAKTVKIKLDIDAQDAIKTSQDLKQQLNEMFQDDGNLGHSMDGLIQQMQVLTQHIDHVTANLGDMFSMFQSLSNASTVGVNAQTLQSQNTQYQEQLRLLTQMNSQMQLLLNQQRQQSTTGNSRRGGGSGIDPAEVEALRAKLVELNNEYGRLEALSQTYADQLASMGAEGQAALAAWATEVANAKPGLEDFAELIENVKQQFANSGIPMSGATEQILQQWANIANQMVRVDEEATRIGNTLNNQVVPAGNRVLNTFSNMTGILSRTFTGMGTGLKRVGAFMSTLSRAASRLRSAFKGIFGIISSVGSGIIGIFQKISSGLFGADKVAKTVNRSFGQLLKTVLATVLGVTGITATLSNIENIANEGLKSLGQSFSEIQNQLDSMEIAWTNFKASIVSIVQPIYSVVQPALAQLVTWITNIMNTVAKFVAAFTGQSFIYKGVATAAKGTGKAAKKATEDVKELVKQLQGFDELNNLTSQKEKEVADTGGGGGGMFDNVKWEKEPIPDWIKDWVAKIKDILKQLFEPLKKAWERMGYWVMSSWKFALEEVWKLVKSIGSAFLKAWNLGTVQKIFEDILFVVGAIGRGIGVIALKFREVWEEDERGVRLFESIFKLIRKITEQLKFLAADTLNWLARIELRPLFDSLLRLLDDLQKPVETLARITRKFIVDVVYKYIKWLIEKGLPKLIDLVDRFIQKVDWGKFETNITKIFGPLEHAMEEISNGILDFIDQVSQEFADWLNSEDFENLTDDIVEFLNNIKSEDVTETLNNIKEAISGFFKQLKEDIDKIWNSEPVQKFITWLKGKDGDPEALGRNIAKVVEAIGGFMILSSVAGLFAPFVTLLGQSLGLIGKISGGLSGLAGAAATAGTKAGATAASNFSSSLMGDALSIGRGFTAIVLAGIEAALAAWVGVEFGNWIASKLNPELKDFLEQYKGPEGKVQEMKDYGKALKDTLTGGLTEDMADSIRLGIESGAIDSMETLHERLDALDWTPQFVLDKFTGANTIDAVYTQMEKELAQHKIEIGISEGTITNVDELTTKVYNLTDTIDMSNGARKKMIEEYSQQLQNNAIDTITNSINNGAIPAEKEMQSQLEETGAKYKEARDQVDTLSQATLDANPKLQALKDSLNDAGIAVESLDSINQIADGFTVFQANGENATNTANYLSKAFESADEFAVYFFEELEKGNPVFQEAADSYTDYVNTMTTETQTLSDNIVNGLPDSEELAESGKNIVAGLISGITGAMEVSTTPLTNSFKGIITAVQDLFKMHSPSVVMEEMGANIVQGLINGWERTIPQMLAIVTNFGSQFANAFTSVKAKVVEVFKSMGTAIMNVLKNVLNSISQAVRSATSSMQYLQNLNTSNIGRHSYVSPPRKVPKLAQGAVIPPNKEFMAVLGDQSHGTNIETPLSTMVDAFNQAGGNRSEQEITLMQEQNQLLRQLLEKEWSISSSQMFSAMQRQAVVYTKQSGKPAF